MFQFTGNVGRDAEVKSVAGKTVIEYSVGVYAGKDKDGNSQTLWVNCAKWIQADQKPNQLDMVKRGDLVLIDAKPNPVRVYTTAGGQQGASLDVLINRCELLKRSEGGAAKAAPVAETKTNPVAAPVSSFDPMGDDLPF